MTSSACSVRLAGTHVLNTWGVIEIDQTRTRAGSFRCPFRGRRGIEDVPARDRLTDAPAALLDPGEKSDFW
jgi:hypothetical protein